METLESRVETVLGAAAYYYHLQSNGHIDMPTARAQIEAMKAQEFAKIAVALSNLSLPPIPMCFYCPACGVQHIDMPGSHWSDHFDAPAETRGPVYEEAVAARLEWEKTAWTNPPHKSHKCAGCGHQWRPADIDTVGVEEINTRHADDSRVVAPVGYHALLCKYIDHVGSCEGIDFITDDRRRDSGEHNVTFTDDEWHLLQELGALVRNS